LGNGGSNSVASHISQDYMKFHNKKVSILSDPSMITMLTNDFGYDWAYQKFLEYYVETDTLVIIMSSGGESENMINCLNWCEENKVSYGVLTGFSENNIIRKNAKNSLWNYYINSDSYGVVECVHQIFLHGVV
jgi:D-sedoheptulose 7-phosphate isomerase